VVRDPWSRRCVLLINAAATDSIKLLTLLIIMHRLQTLAFSKPKFLQWRPGKTSSSVDVTVQQLLQKDLRGTDLEK